MTKNYKRTLTLQSGTDAPICDWLAVMEQDDTVFDWLYEETSKGVALFIRGDAVKAFQQGRAKIVFDEQEQAFVMREQVEDEP